MRRTKKGKLKKLKRGKLENNVNVVFNSNEEKCLLTKLVRWGRYNSYRFGIIIFLFYLEAVVRRRSLK